MQKYNFLLLFLIFSFWKIFAQESYIQNIGKYQDEMNAQFKDESNSPLPKDEIHDFKGLEFFDIDSNYRIKAKFTKNVGKPFKMKTSTARLPVYKRMGYLDFQIDGKPCRLSVFKNVELSKQKNMKDYLFIPFKDLTNGFDSYGGGRYLDLRNQKSDVWELDFNKAYNPYCAYNAKYSCPIPPEENHLNVEIKAGVKKWHD